jgi:hypothetical protein
VLSVTAYAMPQPALVAMPQAIRLPAGPLSPTYRQPVTIRNNSAKPVTLTDPMVNVEGVKVQTTETQPGKLFTLSVTFPTNFQARTDKPMELTVKTSHPKYPVLRVPFIQAAVPSPAIAPNAPRPLTATATNAAVR